MPAIGASTTGDSMTWRPMRSGGSTGAGAASAASCAGASAVIRWVTATHSPQSGALDRIGEAEQRLREGLRLVEVGEVAGPRDHLDPGLRAGPEERARAEPELVEPPVEQQHRACHVAEHGRPAVRHHLAPGCRRRYEVVAAGDDR